MRKKEYLKFSLIYYPLSFIALFAFMYLNILADGRNGGILFRIIGSIIICSSIWIRITYGKKRLKYLGKSTWWIVFSIMPLTEPIFHIVMCLLKDQEETEK